MIQTTPACITRKDRWEEKYGKKIRLGRKISTTGTVNRWMIFIECQERTLLIWYLKRIGNQRKIILICRIRRHSYKLRIRRYVCRVNYGSGLLENCRRSDRTRPFRWKKKKISRWMSADISTDFGLLSKTRIRNQYVVDRFERHWWGCILDLAGRN